jgi:hypothetical protein
MGKRHAIRGFIAGVPKHNSLITSANIEIIFSNVNATSDIGALLIDTNQDFASLVAQSLAIDTGQIVHI